MHDGMTYFHYTLEADQRLVVDLVFSQQLGVIAEVAQKPYYQIRFAVLEPKHLAGCLITGRLYCTARAMWKLSWFLRDFGYDTELLGKDEIDDQALVGLQGVLKISHTIVHGISVLNLDGFAPLSRWKELSPTAADDPPESEVAS